MGVCIPFAEEQLYGGEMSIDAGEVAKAKLADAGAGPATSTAWVCPMCGRDATRCDCSGSTGDIYAWDFWDNDEDAVYDETP